MKTLREIIQLRKTKYATDQKNRSCSDIFQAYMDGWHNAYRDLEEILVQNGFNLDVHVTDVGKTNADHIRSMTDEELAETIVREFCAVSDNTVEFIVAKTRFRLWLKQPYKEDA